ncbi:MAG: DinB family protein [Planctomycetota bacterium]|jgi:hypothetical protein
MTKLAEHLRAQFLRGWETLKEAMERFPEDGFRRGGIDHLIPARQAMHLIETAEFYTGRHPDDMKWGDRFGGYWDSLPPPELPDREKLLEYHEEVRTRVEKWLDNASDATLLAKEEAFPWTGATVMERMIYLLRHHHQHIGEMNAELRRRGIPRAEWR